MKRTMGLLNTRVDARCVYYNNSVSNIKDIKYPYVWVVLYIWML